MSKVNVKLFCFVFVYSLLLVVFPNVAVAEAEVNTITVPDDFSTIQAAINNASEGDTVFVKKGIYEIVEGVQVVINKTVSLIGEDPKDTIILGVFGNISSHTPAFRVAAPDVTISGFTITKFGMAIQTANYYNESYPSNCKIVNNNIVDNGEGIRPRRNDLLVSKNNITDNETGISGYTVQNITIVGNNLTNNGYSISIWESRDVTVGENSFSNNTVALNLVLYGPYFVYGNNMTQNHWAIRFAEGCHNVTLSGNIVSKNDVAVVMLIFPNGGDKVVTGVGNTVFGNIFAENSKLISSYQQIQFPGYSMGTDIVQWDNGTMGNYWDVYDGLDENGDGIGDTPLVLDEQNQDNYPLMNPVDVKTIPEFPLWAIFPLFVLVTLVMLMYKFRLENVSNKRIS